MSLFRHSAHNRFRNHPALQPTFDRVFPGLKEAVAAFSVFVVVDSIRERRAENRRRAERDKERAQRRARKEQRAKERAAHAEKSASDAHH
jgi:hypothetical protein